MSDLKNVKPSEWIKHDKTEGSARVELITDSGLYFIVYRYTSKYRIRIEDGADVGWGARNRFSIGGFWTPEDVEEN